VKVGAFCWPGSGTPAQLGMMGLLLLLLPVAAPHLEPKAHLFICAYISLFCLTKFIDCQEKYVALACLPATNPYFYTK
jgi:hypothetical protein